MQNESANITNANLKRLFVKRKILSQAIKRELTIKLLISRINVASLIGHWPISD